MRIRTEHLEGLALDWAADAAKSGQLLEVRQNAAGDWMFFADGVPFPAGPRRFSSDWAKSGPLQEEEGIFPFCTNLGVEACQYGAKPNKAPSGSDQYGPTPLIAVARCFVAMKLGAEVDVPAQLVGLVRPMYEWIDHDGAMHVTPERPNSWDTPLPVRVISQPRG